MIDWIVRIAAMIGVGSAIKAFFSYSKAHNY